MNHILEHHYYVFLHSCGLTQTELWNIFSDPIKSPKDFFDSFSWELLEKNWIPTRRISSIIGGYEDFVSKNKQEKIIHMLKKLGVSIITAHDKNYPESLRHIPHSPFLLYVRWSIPEGKYFWVVGSRKITWYGKKIIDRIVPDVSKVFTIVSWGAYGCDIAAHKSATANAAKTVVVFWTGIDQSYPAGHKNYYEEIVEKNLGCLLSIFPLWTPGTPYNFPIRNEIVVWLSEGIFVVEAQEKSGSLITANLALDMGKDVFTCPGDITLWSSAGSNMLLKQGAAKLVLAPEDILEEYEVLVKKMYHSKKNLDLEGIEKNIFDILSHSPQDIDALWEILNIPVYEIMSSVSLLELKGVIKKALSGEYSLK